MEFMPSRPRGDSRGEFIHTSIITVTITVIGIIATIALASPFVAGSTVLATGVWVARLASITKE